MSTHGNDPRDARGERYEPLRQPPDPVDLRRHPPTSPECARVRGWMRDYADGDLPAELAAELELHVHGCRTCGLALARAEHEVLRLRRALAGDGTGTGTGGRGRNRVRAGTPAPRPGFARRTVARLLAEEGVEPTVGAPCGAGAAAAPLGEPAPGQDGTTTEEAGPQATGSQTIGPAGTDVVGGGPGELQPVATTSGFYAISAFALALGALLAVSLPIEQCTRAVRALFFGEEPAIVHREHLAILAVDQGLIGVGSDRLTAAPGATVPIGGTLLLGSQLRDGKASVAWVPGGGTAAGARLDVHGQGPLQLREDGLGLDNGSMTVASERSLRVRLGDGRDSVSEVELGIGRYHIDVIEQLTFSSSLLPIEDLKIRVEVQAGEPARIVRGGDVRTLQVGEVAIYGGPSVAIEVVPTGLASALRPIGDRRGSDPAPEVPHLIGAVFERPANSPSVGCNLLMKLLSENGPAMAGATTDLGGNFAWSGNARILGNFAVVQCSPPSSRQDLGTTVPYAYTLLPNGETLRFAQPFQLEPSRPIFGTVVDAQGRPSMGARVVPCVYDETFGLLFPWAEQSVSTDARGNFGLHRLPPRLPPHLSLGVVVLHPTLDARFVPLPVPGSPAAASMQVRIQLQPLVQRAFWRLEPNTEYEILEELTELPPGTGARRYVIRTDSGGGTPWIPTGSGRLWLRSGTFARPQLAALVQTEQNPRILRRSAEPERNMDEVFRQLTLEMPASDFLLSREFRHEHFGAPSPTALQWEAHDDVVGQHVEAHLFAVAPAPGGARVRFLGLVDRYAVLRADLAGQERAVVAIAPDASIGTADAWGGNGVSRLRSIVVARPGSLRLGSAELRPSPSAEQVLLLELRSLDGWELGDRPKLYRFACGDENWTVAGIPAGRYEVLFPSGRTLRCEIAPGAVTVLR